MNMPNGICRIPVRATVAVSHGKSTMIDAEYADIPAAAIAEYIVQHIDPEKIFGKQEGEPE